MKARCGARNRSGGQCGRWAVPGATVCHLHGGKAPQVKAAAEVRVAERKVERWLAAQEIVPVTDPIGLIAELAGKSHLWLRKVEEMVGHLEPAVWRFEDAKGAEQVRTEVVLLERALERCHRQLVDMAKLNLEERLTRVTELQAAALLKVVLAAIDDPGWDLSHEQRATGRKIVARHLPRATS